MISGEESAMRIQGRPKGLWWDSEKSIANGSQSIASVQLALDLRLTL